MSPSPRPSDVTLSEQHLVLALATVDGFTAACAEHGDRATLATLTAYYATLAERVKTSGGRVVKAMGDGVLVTFPVSSAKGAVTSLRDAQEAGTRLWQGFDLRCRVAIRVTAGPVLVGTFGPPGDERDDVFGDTLNQLFKMPPGSFVLSSGMKALLA